MDEKLYQNIDIPQNNPLDIKNDISDSESTSKSDDKVKKTLNPKIIILLALFAFIFVLLIISLVVSQIKQNKIRVTPTPIPTQITTIPTVSDSIVPSQYQESFKKLEQSFLEDPDLPAPQIDISVGQE